MTISAGEEVRQFFKILQDQICSALENTDGKSLFTEDTWTHHNGGVGEPEFCARERFLNKPVLISLM